MLLLTLLACTSSDPTDSGSSDSGSSDSGSSDGGTVDTPSAASWLGIALREDGWLRGDLHVHTTLEGGFDDLATNIALAEYLADPVFVDAHPEYDGNQLDYLSITDHRMVDGQSLPDYQSDQLVLVGGEEFGTKGHAGTHGVYEFVDHDPDGDGVSLDDYQAAVAHTHAQGGTFSPNHPMLPDISFPWDIRDHDGVEVWNSGWALMSPSNTPENVDEWEKSYGPASPLYRRAVQATERNASSQALLWYEAQLARGIHTAVIGGSDRHALLLPGFPTTYIQAADRTELAVLDGIRSRHTFVSRNPTAAQVLLSVDVSGSAGQAGDALVVPGSGATAQVDLRIGRADGGLVQLFMGHGVDSDEALAHDPLGQVVLEESVVGDDVTLGISLDVMPGDWLYVTVQEPLIAPGMSDDQADAIRDLAARVSVTGEEDFMGLATVAADLIDSDVLWDASGCDPDDWDPAMLQCALADEEGLASFFVPDHLDRALNVVVIDDEITEWCMGAVTSAVRFTE